MNINEVLEDSDREEKRPKKKGLEEVKEDDLEISDEEAPNVDQAKQNLRKQAERKRNKKTTIQGVTQDVHVEVPVNEITQPVVQTN